MKLGKAKGRLRGKSPKLTVRQEAHLVRLRADDEHTWASWPSSVQRGPLHDLPRLGSAQRGCESIVK